MWFTVVAVVDNPGISFVILMCKSTAPDEICEAAWHLTLLLVASTYRVVEWITGKLYATPKNAVDVRANYLKSCTEHFMYIAEMRHEHGFTSVKSDTTALQLQLFH